MPKSVPLVQVIVLSTSPKTFTVKVFFFFFFFCCLGFSISALDSKSLLCMTHGKAAMNIFCSFTNDVCEGTFKTSFSIAVILVIPCNAGSPSFKIVCMSSILYSTPPSFNILFLYLSLLTLLNTKISLFALLIKVGISCVVARIINVSCVNF